MTQVRRAEARRAGAEEAAREAEAKAYSLSATVQVSSMMVVVYSEGFWHRRYVLVCFLYVK